MSTRSTKDFKFANFKVFHKFEFCAFAVLLGGSLLRVRSSSCWLTSRIMSAVTGSTAGTAGVLAPESPHSGLKRSLDQDPDRPSSDSNKKHKQDLASLPTRQYLDQTVVPILLQVVSSFTLKLFDIDNTILSVGFGQSGP